MKYHMPEISWHERDPVYSVDFQAQPEIDENNQDSQSSNRIATGGIDKVIRIWKLIIDKEDSSKCRVEFLSTLRKHQAAINAVRFDPKGEVLASGDVEAVIFLWRKAESSNAPDIFGVESDDEPNKEDWKAFKSLRHHVKDVCDLTWSPDSLFLASVSVDKSLMVWNVLSGKHESLKKHRQFPNGVAWDPKGKYLVTLGTDREMVLCEVKKGRPTCSKKITKAKIKGHPSSEAGTDEQRLFLDDSLMSFVRRPAWSPRGELLFTPAGSVEIGGKSVNATLIFSRTSLDCPSVILPCPEKATVAVRCSPVLYELDPNRENLFKLPYRVVFAVMSQEAVILYHSQQQRPFAYFTKIHYCSLTDLSWSFDGRFLLVSSMDGFCSLVTFESDELGTPLASTAIPEAPPSPIPTKTPKSNSKKQAAKKEKSESASSTSAKKEVPDPSKVAKKEVEDVKIAVDLDQSGLVKKEEQGRPKKKKPVTLAEMWSKEKKEKRNGAEAEGDKESNRSDSVARISGSESSVSPVLVEKCQKRDSEVAAVHTTPTGCSPAKKIPRRVNFVTLGKGPENLFAANPEYRPKVLSESSKEDTGTLREIETRPNHQVSEESKAEQMNSGEKPAVGSEGTVAIPVKKSKRATLITLD